MPKRESAARVVQPLTARSVDVRHAALTLFAERGYHGTTMRDIAAALNLQAASLYNHISTKQEILRDVMADTMYNLTRAVRSAMDGVDDTVERLRRAAEAQARYHTRHQRDARVGNHEIAALDEPHRSAITALRREHSRMFVRLIEQGCKEGVFETRSPRLAAYAILQMGIGVSLWFQPDGPLSEDEVVFEYGTMALRVAGAVRVREPKKARRRAPRPARKK